MTWVFDGHLDLAMNALVYERDQTLPVAALREREAPGVTDGRGRCSCSLHEMKRGGVRLCVATVLARAKPWIDPCREIKRANGDWPSPDMAHATAAGQLAYYDLLDRRGDLTLIRDREALAAHIELWESLPEDATIGVIVTLEGADAVTEPDELAWWHGQGVRTLMLAHFGQSHYAAGTPTTDRANPHDVDGPLTDRGRALLDRMAKLRMPLDLTHLSDQSFAEAVERFNGVIYASHSSCRTRVPDNDHVHPMRMLTDVQIKTIVERGGVVGLPMFNAFLKPGYRQTTDPDTVTLADVADHADHVCQLAGSVQHVALGSDADGGFGTEHTPREMDTIADLPRVGEVLSSRGYTNDDIAAILHGNWLRFFSENLPAG